MDQELDTGTMGITIEEEEYLLPIDKGADIVAVLFA